MLVLIDNNFADRDDMRDSLAASCSNLAALPATVFEEWFKAKSPDTTHRVQQIACALLQPGSALRVTGHQLGRSA